MSDNFISGKVGQVGIGASVFSFNNWKANMKANLPKITNFTSGGYQALLGGIISATVTVSGPYNNGNMPFAVATSYVWILGFTNSINLTITAVVESIDVDDDVDAFPKITITSQSNGSFTAAIV